MSIITQIRCELDSKQLQKHPKKRTLNGPARLLWIQYSAGWVISGRDWWLVVGQRIRCGWWVGVLLQRERGCGDGDWRVEAVVWKEGKEEEQMWKECWSNVEMECFFHCFFLFLTSSLLLLPGSFFSFFSVFLLFYLIFFSLFFNFNSLFSLVFLLCLFLFFSITDFFSLFFVIFLIFSLFFSKYFHCCF